MLRLDSAALMISMPSPSSMPASFAAVLHAVLAAAQQRGAEPLVHEARRGADHLFLLALGEDDALGRAAQPRKDLHQRAGDRIAPRVQLMAVGVHVDDRLARDAGVHRRLGHRRRHR